MFLSLLNPIPLHSKHRLTFLENKQYLLPLTFHFFNLGPLHWKFNSIIAFPIFLFDILLLLLRETSLCFLFLLDHVSSFFITLLPVFYSYFPQFTHFTYILHLVWPSPWNASILLVHPITLSISFMSPMFNIQCMYSTLLYTFNFTLKMPVRPVFGVGILSVKLKV